MESLSLVDKIRNNMIYAFVRQGELRFKHHGTNPVSLRGVFLLVLALALWLEIDDGSRGVNVGGAHKYQGVRGRNEP